MWRLEMFVSCSDSGNFRGLLEMKKSERKKQFSFVGRDCDLDRLSEIDGSWEQTPEERFATICAISLFEYQLRNETADVPRLLRTTACIRKP